MQSGNLESIHQVLLGEKKTKHDIVGYFAFY